MILLLFPFLVLLRKKQTREINRIQALLGGKIRDKEGVEVEGGGRRGRRGGFEGFPSCFCFLICFHHKSLFRR